MVNALTFPIFVFRQGAYIVQRATGFCLRKIQEAFTWITSRSLRDHCWTITHAANVHTCAIRTILPSLLVPTLQESIDRYLKSIEPFFSAEEMRSIRTRSNYFVAHEGAELQKALVQHASTKVDWFKEIGLKIQLEKRGSLLESVRYCTDTSFPIRNHYDSRADRAARIAYLMVQYKNLYLNDIFGSVRIPGKKCDRLEFHPNSKHIAVFVEGHIYIVEVVGVSEAEIAGRFKWILSDVLNYSNAAPASLLTLQERGVWAQQRAKLDLKEIETALFALRFSDKKPASEEEEVLGLIQHVNDLWLDKGMNLTVFANSRLGGIFESSIADSATIANLMDWVYKNEAYVRPRGPATLKNAIPHRIAFQAITNSIETPMDIKICTIRNLGEQTLQNPDSFVQMALQLAYYNLYEHIPFTHQSVGRGVVRSASYESLNFCRTMNDDSKTREEKQNALKAAVNAHAAHKQAVVNGKSCDEHLLALKHFAGNRFVVFFNGKDFHLRCELHSEQMQTCFGSGFFPDSRDGFAVSYQLYQDRIKMHVSSYLFHDGTSENFHQYIIEALTMMREIYE